MTFTEIVTRLPIPRLEDVRFPEWKTGFHILTDGPDGTSGAATSLAEAA